MTDSANQPTATELRRFGLTLRQRQVFLYLTLAAALAIIGTDRIEKWIHNRPHLAVTVFPSTPLAEAFSFSQGVVMIENDGTRPATNVVCTVANCAPQQVIVRPVFTDDLNAATELRPDGATVAIPELKPRAMAHIVVMLKPNSDYTAGDVAVRGDGVVGGPHRDKFAFFRNSLYVIGAPYVLTCLYLWRQWRKFNRPAASTS